MAMLVVGLVEEWIFHILPDWAIIRENVFRNGNLRCVFGGKIGVADKARAGAEFVQNGGGLVQKSEVIRP